MKRIFRELADMIFDDPCRETYASPFLSVREYMKADRVTEKDEMSKQ